MRQTPPVRSIFDQYTQQENKLTHALACALHHDRSLLVPFIRWIGIDPPAPASKLRVAQQTIPGRYDAPEEAEQRGLPDLVVHDDDGWAVLIESKVQSGLTTGQLERHGRTADRCGFKKPHLVAITVDRPKAKVGNRVRCVLWRELYAWFTERATRSFFAGELVSYMHALERQMIEQDYQVRGTITMFSGLRFDDENPYTYAEGKRLIRLLGDQLQSRSDLRSFGIDPKGQRRSAITGRTGDAVWDFLPLAAAKSAKSFTDYPHLTLGISRTRPTATVTVPHGVKGGFRTRLQEIGYEGFRSLILEIENRLRPIVKKSKGAYPNMYALQRHYRSQRSVGTVDARIETDLRTVLPNGSGGVKHQPQWAEAIFKLLTEKRSNIQFGVEMRLDYTCPVVRSAACEDLFAESWIACAPLIDLALGK